MSDPSLPEPDRALLILANAVAEVVGPRSTVFQHILVAASTHTNDDHVRARAEFDGLPGSQRRAVKGKAETTAIAVRQQSVLRKVLRNLPRWRPENVEWVWPSANKLSASNQK
jgi:hypothetical protein